MAEKTIKVDEAVHRRLDELKQEYGAETFNEVLRYELDIISNPELEELAAYLHQELFETASEAVETIRAIGEFEERVGEERRTEVLEFVDSDSSTTIASITFDEKSFQIRYRAQSGEMKKCGRGWYSSTSDEPKYGRIGSISDHTEPGDVIEQVRTKVSGAYRRWGS